MIIKEKILGSDGRRYSIELVATGTDVGCMVKLLPYSQTGLESCLQRIEATEEMWDGEHAHPVPRDVVDACVAFAVKQRMR